MGMAFELLYDRVHRSNSAVSTIVNNGTATATVAAVSDRHVILKAVGSFDSQATALLQVSSGGTVIAKKYIYNEGEIDFGEWGRQANNDNEAISADLFTGGAVNGVVTLEYYTTGKPA